MTTQEVLQQCTVDGLLVRLPDVKLDRKEYLDVAGKLQLIGGKWKGGKTQAFVFEQDPTELLAEIANGEDRNLKKEFQFFATPTEVSEMMVEKIPFIEDGFKILEPSGGDGAIIKQIRGYASGGEKIEIDTYEAMELNRMKLSKLEGVNILGDDFLQCDRNGYYDIIIANPPFTKNQDIDHIVKMYEVCKPGGTIVTLSSPSWTFGSNKKQLDFKAWLAVLHAKTDLVAEGAFKESGTTIRTMLIVIKKPLQDPEGLPSMGKHIMPKMSAEMVEKAQDYIKEHPVKEAAAVPQFDAGTLKDFKKLIDLKMEEAQEDLKQLNFILSSRKKNIKIEGYEDVSPTDVNDMICRQNEYMADLEAAYVRVKNKSFGVCQSTGQLMDIEFLKNYPQLTNSKEAMEFAGIPLPEPILKKHAEAVEVRKCRVCGCTDDDCSQCIKKTGEPCHWVEDDLCSACVVPEPEEILEKLKESNKAVDQSLNELSKLLSPNNDNAMNFFEQLAAMGNVDLTIRIMQKNEKLTLNVMPGSGASTIKPILITGTGSELDAAFFNTIAPGVQEIAGIISNLDEVKTEAIEKQEKKAAAKPAEKSKTQAKKETTKNKPDKTKKQVSKTVIPEASLFNTEVEEPEAAEA